jgi:hypothetical protein
MQNVATLSGSPERTAPRPARRIDDNAIVSTVNQARGWSGCSQHEQEQAK